MLLSLPPELFISIQDFIPLQDLLTLSTTSKEIRQLLIPRLFHSLRFTNEDKDQQILNRIINKYGPYIRDRYFECYLYGNEEEEEEEEEREDGSDSQSLKRAKVPDLACKILQGQVPSKLGNALTIEFKPDDDFQSGSWGSSELGEGSIYIAEASESFEMLWQNERDFQWRADMARIWALVITDKSIRKLKIKNFPPRCTSTWFTPRWHFFLGQLEELSIGLWAGDNGAGWQSNTLDGYTEFVDDLRHNIFKHTNSLKRLSLIAHELSPIGCEGRCHASFPLESTDIPMLEYLHLENCFIDPELVSFLQDHTNTLKHLRLQNCMSAGSDEGDFTSAQNPISWAEFFKTLRRSKLRLRTFQHFNNFVPLTKDEDFFFRFKAENFDSVYQPPEDEPAETQAVRRCVKEDDKKLFYYGTLDDKYGMLDVNEEEIIASFQHGHDQMEYEAFVSSSTETHQ
jgi:hypothetical protein